MEIFKKISNLWKNFKSQPDVWFFYAFLATFTLSVRKVLFFYPVDNIFNEYSSVYLYLSDIFLFLTVITWIFTLQNKSSLLSIVKTIKNRRLLMYILPLCLVLWSFISILWSSNVAIAWFRSIKFLELYLLYLYIVNVPRGTFANIIRIIISIGFFQSILAIWQFVIQRSIGIFWLKESIISPNIAGVAKVVLNGQRHIRAYGLFPHPNILGGFLLFSLILGFFNFKLFHVEQLWFGKKISKIIFWIVIMVQAIALALSISKSAILGLLIGLIFIIVNLIVPRGTIISKIKFIIRMFHVEQFKRYGKKLILISLILIFLFALIRPDLYSLFLKSLDERLLYLNVSRGTILNNAFLGVGSGQFVWDIAKYVPRGTILLNWQFQPVHNVFLLIWSELGLVGLALIAWFLWKMFHVEQYDESKVKCEVMSLGGQCEIYKPSKNVSRGTIDNQRVVFQGILTGFIFIMLFDHYFWDIQQGEIMLWMMLGFIANFSIDKK